MRRFCIVAGVLFAALAAPAQAAPAPFEFAVTYLDQLSPQSAEGGQGRAGLLWFARSGSSRRVVEKEGSVEGSFDGVTPQGAPTSVAWSPTSRRVAYTAAGSLTVFTTRADGEDQRAIETGSRSSSISDVAWSPDGKRVAILDGAIHIAPDGGKPRRVTSAGDIQYFAWSSRNKFVFERRGFDNAVGCPNRGVCDNSLPTNGIWISDVDGRRARRIVKGRGYTLLGVNPAGTRLLVVENREPQWKWLLDLSGKRRERVRAEGTEVAWTPDGRIAVFERDPLGTTWVVAQRIDGSSRTRVRLPDPEFDYRTYTSLSIR